MRVVEFAELVDEVDDATEVMIRLLDEPGVHLHLAGVHTFARRPTGRPTRARRGRGPTARCQAGIRSRRASWRSNTIRRYSSHPMSNRPRVPLDPLLFDVMGRMAGAERVVEEERFVRRVDVRVLDEQRWRGPRDRC